MKKHNCNDCKSRHQSFQVYLQEVDIMDEKNSELMWGEMPSEDRDFYVEFAASTALALAIVLLAWFMGVAEKAIGSRSWQRAV